MSPLTGSAMRRRIDQLCGEIDELGNGKRHRERWRSASMAALNCSVFQDLPCSRDDFRVGDCHIPCDPNAEILNLIPSAGLERHRLLMGRMERELSSRTSLIMCNLSTHFAPARLSHPPSELKKRRMETESIAMPTAIRASGPALSAAV
jgi:hypothetical protein